MAQAAATSGYWDPERRCIDSRDAAYLLRTPALRWPREAKGTQAPLSIAYRAIATRTYCSRRGSGDL